MEEQINMKLIQDILNQMRRFLLLLVLLLPACVPSPSTLQTAIAQTQAANPTSTFTPIPPTETLTKTPTETPKITHSPTPDLLVLQLNLKDFLLKKSDLPLDANYYLFNRNSIYTIPNEEVEIGGAYLAETGRIDGWIIFYERGSNNVVAPESIYDEVILYKTTAGAQLEITKYCDNLVTEEGFTEEINPPEIGDLTRAFLYRKMHASGEYQVTYRIEFSYQNFVHEVNGYGWEHEVKPEFVRNIARILLARLQAATLSNP
jgi:hypothetical protein